MPSQETAIEEIQGRITTLNSQAAFARNRAKEFTEEAATETANAERMERLQREYMALMNQHA